MRRTRLRRSPSGAQYLPPPDRWLLSYADFVTLLLAVFIVLLASVWHRSQPLSAVATAIHSGFSKSSAGKAQPAPQAESVSLPKPQQPAPPDKIPGPQVDTAALQDELRGVLGDAMDRDEVVLQQTPEGLVIRLRELGSFHSGGAVLLPGAAAGLRNTGKVLMQHGLGLRVEGHSDDQPIHTGTFESNWQLSTARAMSVLRLLLDGADFPPERVSVAGYGPYHPIADNTTAEGRRTNRRVDLVVFAPQTRQEAAPTQVLSPLPPVSLPDHAKELGRPNYAGALP